MPASAIILAAGRSTRMKSRLPKPLHEICGKPMLGYILEACLAAGCERLMVVVGHGKEKIMGQFGDEPRIGWIEQTEQLGTGHAARACEAELRKISGDVFVLAGDTPLIRAEILRTLLAAHRQSHAAASMATALLDDPTGYGRIVRDGQGRFERIVEQLDCTPQQRDIREVFPSLYCVRCDELLAVLPKLTTANKKGEYYLTDIYALLHQAGKKITAVQAATAEDVLAPNTRQQLAEADAAMQERIQRNVRDGGVTLVSGINTYIEAGVSVGADTVIQPFTFIGRDASVGGQCVIGPFASVPRGAIVPERTVLAGNVTPQAGLLDAVN
jgi:bifunctional UDP-N-acetylglucosamine pyrophosphorylase / glucosamine-1-phosphate N-acetyltransferase